MLNELISIIIPVYNVEKYLGECLTSAVSQSYEDIEIVIINDGSTDGSLGICESFAEKDDRVRIVSQSNQGLGAARNAGLELAHGEYIVFLDSDDYLHVDFCGIMYNAIKINQILLAVCHATRIRENGENVPSTRRFVKGISELLSTDEIIQRIEQGEENFFATVAWGKMYHKSLFFPSTNRYPINVHYEDNWLSMKLYVEAKKVCVVSDELIYYRMRYDSITKNILLHNKSLTDYIFQITDTISVLFSCDTVSINSKMSFYHIICKIIGNIYYDYLLAIYSSRILNDSLDYNEKLALFGAGTYGTRFQKTILSSMSPESIVFVDNNSELHDTKKGDITIIPLEKYVSEYKDHRIIITTQSLFEVIAQLRNAGVLSSMSEIFPNGGKTTVERAFIKGIEYFISTLSVYGVP